MRRQVAHEGSGRAHQEGEDLTRALLLLALAGLGCEKPEHGATGALAFTDPNQGAQVPEVVEALKSGRIAGRVVTHLGLGGDAYWGGNDLAATARLQKMIRARQRGAQAALEVTVVEPDAKRAVQVCNVVMAAYLESRLQQRMVSVRARPGDEDKPLLNDLRIVEVCTFK